MEPNIVLGNLIIAPDSARVWVGALRVDLTYSEFELLLKLARRPGRIMGRDEMVRGLGEDTPNGHRGRLNVHIHRLRRKLELSSPWQIETVRRRGYVLRMTGSESDGALEGLSESREVS